MRHLLLAFILLFYQYVAAPLFSQATTTGETIILHIDNLLDEDNLQGSINYIDSIQQTELFSDLSCYHKGKIYHLLGVSYYFLNAESTAISIFRDSTLTIWDNCPNVSDSEIANTVYNIGVAYQYTDESYLAKPYLDKALNIFQSDTSYSKTYLAEHYRGAGSFYQEIHDFQRAETYFLNALSLYEQLSQTEEEIFDIYNLLIVLNLDFREYKKASDYLERAINKYNASPHLIDPVYLCQAYLNGAEAYRGLGEYDEAIQLAKKGLSLIKRNQDPYLYSIGLEVLGSAYKDLGNYERSQQYFQDVLSIRSTDASDRSDTRSMSIALENIGGLFSVKKDFDNALLYIDHALASILPAATFDMNNNPVIASTVINDAVSTIRLLSIKAEICSQLFGTKNNLEYLQQSLHLQYKIDSLINQNILSFQSEYSKLRVYELLANYYGQGLEAALQLFKLTSETSYLHDAYFFSSKSKSLILQSQIIEAKALEAIASAEILAEESRLTERLNDIRALTNDLSAANDSLIREYGKAQLDLDLFIQSIENENPEYYNRKHGYRKPKTVADIKDILRPNQALVEYFFAQDSIYSFWISKTDFFYTTVDTSSQLISAANDYIQQIQSRTIIPSTHSTLLYDQLLAKGLEKLPHPCDQLSIVPDDILHSLPFDALVTSTEHSTRFLIEDYTISVDYSSGMLFNSRSLQPDVHSYVGYATNYGPDLNYDLLQSTVIQEGVRLSGFNLAEQEVTEGASIFDGISFLSKQATKKNFYDHAVGADIIHLSLHGLINAQDPSKSCIIFDNHHPDFILTALDLYSTDLNPGLVVLSACNTANGKVYRGEGVQGMSKAFILSGASAIVSSLWNASERSSKEILTSFFTSVKNGTSAAKSLRRAKLSYLKSATPSQRQPYYWANYIMIGDMDVTPTAMSLPWTLLLSLMIIIVAVFITKKKRS